MFTTVVATAATGQLIPKGPSQAFNVGIPSRGGGGFLPAQGEGRPILNPNIPSTTNFGTTDYDQAFVTNNFPREGPQLQMRDDDATLSSANYGSRVPYRRPIAEPSSLGQFGTPPSATKPNTAPEPLPGEWSVAGAPGSLGWGGGVDLPSLPAGLGVGTCCQAFVAQCMACQQGMSTQM